MCDLEEKKAEMVVPDFSPQGYKDLINLLKRCNYSFDNYESWQNHEKTVILRHDIDVSISKAVKLSNLEKELEVTSTYFVLLRSNFYNPLSPDSIEALLQIIENGSEIGLHYDETLYDDELHVQHIQDEACLLSRILDKPITKVSMHRPSRSTLNEFWEIPGMVNSYSKEFFSNFKYVSDSRCRWREPVMEIIKNGQYSKLHVLTHPNWYNGDGGIQVKIQRFLNDSYRECYENLSANFTDLASVVSPPQYDL